MISKETIQQIKEASAKATKGPWLKVQDGHLNDIRNCNDFSIAINTPFNDADFICLTRNHIDELIERVEELEKNNSNFHGICIDYLRLKYVVNDLTAENEKMREALENILAPQRLRDTLFLASNPPQNAAVWDIQNIARECLASLEVKP